jgi:ABC-type transporter Mla maintaining outer membrane lipid asymmetry ATPase subunit MlaF
MTEVVPLVFEDVALPGVYEPGLSLEIPEHSATAIIGKTTTGVDSLGSIALGLTSPARGRALLYGQVISKMPRRHALAFRRKVGYLPAGDGLLQNLTLRDNVALPLRFGSDLSERETTSRVGLMLSMFGVGDAADLRPVQATVEQRRRSALARALAFDPPLVILEQLFDGITPRAGSVLLDLALGGVTAAGSRRALFLTGRYLPDQLRSRIEHRYRLVDGALSRDD